MSGIVNVARKLSPIVLIAGAGMMVFAFAMPWWGITVTILDAPKGSVSDPEFVKEKKKYDKDVRNKDKEIARNMRWYLSMRVDADITKTDETTTIRLWGPNTGTGISTFILGLIVLPLGIVPIFVTPYRRWSWIGFYVAAVMGLVMFILGMVFYFGSPGKNTEYLAQGVGLSPGPFLAIFGSFAVLASGVFGGVVELIEFINSLKPEKRKRRRRKSPPPPEFDDEDDAVDADNADAADGANSEFDDDDDDDDDDLVEI